jgi:hypothetical protein
VIEAKDRHDGGFDVVFEAQGPRRSGPFGAVVNALWANRPLIDRRYGLPARGQWINRHKLGINVLHGVPPEALTRRKRYAAALSRTRVLSPSCSASASAGLPMSMRS